MSTPTLAPRSTDNDERELEHKIPSEDDGSVDSELTEDPDFECCGDKLPLSAHPPIWKRIPNTSFGIGMGLAGQSILWEAIVSTEFINVSVAATIGFAFWIASIAVTALLLICFSRKCIYHFPLVQNEIDSPTRIHFFNMPVRF